MKGKQLIAVLGLGLTLGLGTGVLICWHQPKDEFTARVPSGISDAPPVDSAIGRISKSQLVKLKETTAAADTRGWVNYTIEPREGMTAYEFDRVKVDCNPRAYSGIFALEIDSRGSVAQIESLAEPAQEPPVELKTCRFKQMKSGRYITLFGDSPSSLQPSGS